MMFNYIIFEEFIQFTVKLIKFSIEMCTKF